MKGMVTMRIDRENINQAVEDWLEKELATRPKVESVNQGDQYSKGEFTVVFSHDSADNPA